MMCCFINFNLILTPNLNLQKQLDLGNTFFIRDWIWNST